MTVYEHERDRLNLASLPRGRQMTVARNSSRLGNRQFVEHLIEHAKSLRAANPSGMLWELRLAVTISDRVSPGAELASKARIELANALRIVGRHGEAECLLRAVRIWVGSPEASESLALRCRYLSVLASLQTAQGRPELAAESVRESLLAAEGLGDVQLVGRLLLQLAFARSEFDPVEALELTTRAASLIDPADQYLQLTCYHNGVEYLLLMGCAAEAERSLRRLEPRYESFGDLHCLGMRELVGAHIAEALRLPGVARQRYLRAIDFLAGVGRWHQVAIASLELGALEKAAGEVARCAALVGDALTILGRDPAMRRDSQLSVLRRALLRDVVTESLLRETASKLTRQAA